jgi:hypothetical protein
MDRFAGGPLFGFWFNPREGTWHASGEAGRSMKPFASDLAAGPGVPVREFAPPGETGAGRDWVLVLSRNPALQ